MGLIRWNSLVDNTEPAEEIAEGSSGVCDGQGWINIIPTNVPAERRDMTWAWWQHQEAGSRQPAITILTETPMLSGFKKSKAGGTLHEWLTDTLGTANAGRVAEGATFSSPTLTARTRVGNYCQINREGFEVSDTLDAVDRAGVKGGEYEYQMARHNWPVAA